MICSECGARLSPNAARCDLCGTPAEIEEAARPPDVTETETMAGTPEEEGTGSVCPSCGNAVEESDRFCRHCGQSLEQKAPSQPRPARPQPASASTLDGRKTVMWIVGSIVLVAGLYLISVWRKGADSAPPAAHATSRAPVIPDDDGNYEPLGPDLAERSGAIEGQLQSADSDSLRDRLRTQLVDLFLQAGRPDHAGRIQEEIALDAKTADAWTLAGNFHYDWMEGSAEGPAKVIAARRAIRAYLSSLELEPDNLDVRTDLGAAYLNDPGNAMEAVLQTNRVLETDPTHIQANFNKGVMLVQIGRLDRAIEQFETVRSLTDPDSEIYLRAHEAEERVRSMMTDPAAG